MSGSVGLTAVVAVLLWPGVAIAGKGDGNGTGGPGPPELTVTVQRDGGQGGEPVSGTGNSGDGGAVPAEGDETSEVPDARELLDAICPEWAGPPPSDTPTNLGEELAITVWQLADVCGRRLIVAPILTADDLIPDLYDQASAQLPLPEPTFLPLDAEFGWTYVQVGTDVRIASSLEPVSATATASGGGVTIWATVTATPTRITFEPGEPGAAPLVCTPDAATAGYDPDAPGTCSHTYHNSSAISPNSRTFTTTTTIDWAVTYTSSSGSGTRPAITTSTTQELAVAEIQALVTCTGPRPEQGGC